MVTKSRPQPHPRRAAQSPGSSPADTLRETLCALINLSGLSPREIERRVARRGGAVDLVRLLAGSREMKLRDPLDVAHALGVHPTELYRLCFGEPEQPSPLVAGAASALATAKPWPANPASQPRRPAARRLRAQRRLLRQLMHLVIELSETTSQLDQAAIATPQRRPATNPSAPARDHLVALARRDPQFIGSALAKYQQEHDLDAARLAAWLGCGQDALLRLSLCRLPGDRIERSPDELLKIARFAPCNPDSLAHLLREVSTLGALEPGGSAGTPARQARENRKRPHSHPRRRHRKDASR
jgi:hypothetical protein